MCWLWRCCSKLAWRDEMSCDRQQSVTQSLTNAYKLSRCEMRVRRATWRCLFLQDRSLKRWRRAARSCSGHRKSRPRNVLVELLESPAVTTAFVRSECAGGKTGTMPCGRTSRRSGSVGKVVDGAAIRSTERNACDVSERADLSDCVGTTSGGAPSSPTSVRVGSALSVVEPGATRRWEGCKTEAISSLDKSLADKSLADMSNRSFMSMGTLYQWRGTQASC